MSLSFIFLSAVAAIAWGGVVLCGLVAGLEWLKVRKAGDKVAAISEAALATGYFLLWSSAGLVAYTLIKLFPNG